MQKQPIEYTAVRSGTVSRAFLWGLFIGLVIGMLVGVIGVLW